MDGGEQITVVQDRKLSTILGLTGVLGLIVLFSAELMELKIDLGLATLQRKVVMPVLRRCNLIHKLVTTDHAQLTEDGAIGVNGRSAPCHVEVEKILDLVLVTTPHHNMVVPIVMVMQPKQDPVMKILVQLMEDSAIGMNGQHALLNAEAETKQELDDATTLYQNLVVWNARVTLQNANVATWILVHRLALHKHSEESLFQIDILKRF